MDVQDDDTLLLIGRVGKPHGLCGTCKVIPETDDPTRFSLLKRVYLGAITAQVTSYEVEDVRLQHTRRGTAVLLQLGGVNTLEEAAVLSRSFVFAQQDDLPPLVEGEFFLHDIVGLDVWTDEGEQIGSVRDIWEMPASNVYVVARPGKRDALIPAVPAFIDQIDRAASRLVVRPVEGLLD